VWDENDVPQGPVEIWVDLRRQTISVFRAGHEIGSAIIAYGAEDKQTPTGKFEILSKHRHYRSRSYGADMPYSLFITNDGIALHSSVLRPRHATHGCIGLPEGFARRLFAAAGVGALVQITRSDPDALEDLVTPA
jgi:lipoprotein-anchoring transpeptidase ErfK/SrfK